jgi:hypothetical protein
MENGEAMGRRGAGEEQHWQETLIPALISGRRWRTGNPWRAIRQRAVQGSGKAERARENPLAMAMAMAMASSVFCV